MRVGREDSQRIEECQRQRLATTVESRHAQLGMRMDEWDDGMGCRSDEEECSRGRGLGRWKKDALADEAGSSLIEMAGGLCEFVDSPWRVMFALPLKSVQCLGKPVLIERDGSYCFVSVAMENCVCHPV